MHLSTCTLQETGIATGLGLCRLAKMVAAVRFSSWEILPLPPNELLQQLPGPAHRTAADANTKLPITISAAAGRISASSRNCCLFGYVGVWLPAKKSRRCRNQRRLIESLGPASRMAGLQG